MKLPKKAKRVFKGIIYDVYHWRQRMYDGSYETFEGLKRADTVNVLPVMGNKIVFGLQRQPTLKPFIGLFGGRVDRKERPLAAAKRELLEETGLASRDWLLVKTFEFSSKVEWKSYFFVARNCRWVQKPRLDAGEKIELRLVSLQKFLDLAASAKFRDKEVALELLRLRLAPKKLSTFRQQLFDR